MKGKFTPEFLQAIKDKVNLVDVVREHVVLRKTGSNHMGKCPFHNDGSPSFSVSENKQLYHCFGCGKSGDLFAFVMELQGISFHDAIEELAERGNVPLPKGMAEENEDPATAKLRADQREKLKLATKLNRFVAKFFRDSLPKTPHAAKYFDERGVSGEIAEQFYVGAAPASWDALSRHLVAAKAPLPLAHELGLIHPSQKNARAAATGPGYFDAFRNRAIFPILDSRGKVVGFGGRALELPPGAPETGGEGAKYINSSGSFLFNKSKALYGLFQAQKHIREKREVILVEGYFDVVALHKAGFTHAVATCGTALGAEHLKILRRFDAKIIVLFDGDEAGREATRKSMETGLEQGMILYGASLPDDQDPDEVLLDEKGGVRPEGTREMEGRLAAATPILETFIAEQGAQAILGPDQKSAALKSVASILAKYPDPVSKQVWIENASTRLEVPTRLLLQAMEASGSRGRITGAPSPVSASLPPAPRVFQPKPVISTRPVAKASPARVVKMAPAEKILAQAFVLGGEFTEILAAARAHLPPALTLADFFDYPPARAFVDQLASDPGALERLRVSPDDFLNSEKDPQFRSALAEVLVASSPPFTKEKVQAAIYRSLSKVWARFSQHIKAALASAEAKKDAELHAKWMKEFLDVQRKMKEFSVFYDEAQGHAILSGET